MGAWSFSHSDGGGGAKSFNLLNWGAQKALPCLKGRGGGKKFWTRDFPIL